jgi:toxin ParE1/3/4
MPAHNRVLRLTPLAEADLEDIWRYTFDRWSLEQASQYHNDLVATMQGLARGDKIGRVCRVRDGYQQYAAGWHILFYRETARTLDVIRVLHQRMDIDRHL